MLLFGGIFYAIYAEGTVQPWADDDNKDDSDEKTSFKSWQKACKLLFNELYFIKYLVYY